MRVRPEPTIRAAVLQPLLPVLEQSVERGLPLLARHGLSRAMLADPNRPVALHRYIALFEDLAEAVGDPVLGLRLAQGVQLDLLGPIGLFFGAAPTLRRSLESLSRFLAVWQGGTQLLIRPDPDGRAICYRIEEPALWPRRQDAEFTIAATCAMIRLRLGPRWTPVAVRFEHPGPASSAQHARVFNRPVSFGHSTNALVVSEQDLSHRLANGNAGVAALVERHLHDLLRRIVRDDTVRGRAAFVIASRLGREPVGVATVAAELGLSVRSLQRHLADEGTTLRALVEGERLRIARTLLDGGAMSVDEVARTVGYAEGSVLSRAFHLWTGRPPRRWRAPPAR